MTREEVTTEVQSLIGDTLSQVSAARVAKAVDEAWKDAWVAVPVFDDTSLVFDSSVYKYTIPSTLSTIDAAYLPTTTANPEEIDSSLWEVVGNEIIFQRGAVNRIPTGYTLYLRGKKKLTLADDLPTTNLPLQNYVINLAAWKVISRMTYTKIFAFVKNDTSVAELINFKNTIERDVATYRQQLQMSYVNG